MTDSETGAKDRAAATAGPGAADPHLCDVMILGSGLGGSITAAILARQGATVVLVDAGSHPRFAVGESMTPQLVEWLHLLRLRYDVPEIGHLLDVKAITKNIGPFHGRKQNFGFVRHEVGKEPNPHESTMFASPKTLTEAGHLYRQDTDSYYFNVAARYGATLRQNWRATGLDFDDDGVTVTGHNGEVFRAKFLIDASGFRSPLAEKFDLREKPARFKHHSRSLFTHYVGIKPYDDVCFYPEELRPPAPFHAGTLHHLIDRGWFWIIPFDNYKDSKNPVCSVGLTFDERVYPKPTDMTPEEEFHFYLDRYPAVKRQFDGAKRIREWVSTDRLQYSSSRTVGPRWCLMSHAAGFIDPLFSRGLSNTFEVVDALCSRLLASLRDDDFSVERYEYVEQLERGLLNYNDEIVNNSYISFSHFRLWNLVFRMWASFTTPTTMRLLKARQRFALDGDDRHFQELEKSQYTGLWWPDSPTFKRLFDTVSETCEKYEAGELDGDTAADILFKAYRECDVVNTPFGWKDEEQHYFLPSTPTMLKFLWWTNTQAPPEMRELGRALLTGMVKSGLKGKKVN
ncbi:MAG TPA: tryptophan 7-halogenase [Mycobacteriales bacterium]|nr:tryptophan 7-halogenase [Mycobacteriales bacterium]